MTKERIKSIRQNAGQRVDKFLNRWISKKLTVFVVASYGLFGDKLDGDNWTIVATGYVAIQGFTDIIERLYKVKNGQNND
jgi:Fe-S cluster assembly ATPase SufC